MKISNFIYKNNKQFIVLFDLLLVTFSFFIVVWIKPATIRIMLPSYITPFLFYLFIWLAVSSIMGKYEFRRFKKPSHLIITITIITFVNLSIISILVFAFKLSTYSRLVVFGTIVLCFLFELISFRIIYKLLKTETKKNKLPKKKELLYSFQSGAIHVNEVKRKKEKKGTYSKEELITRESGAEVYNYVSQHLNFSDQSVRLAATTTAFNIENLSTESLKGIINLKKVNDMRYINDFFEAVNAKLSNAGIFIGCVETSKQRYHRFSKSFPPIINQLVIILDFVVNRILPKLTLFRKMYFNMTSGLKQTISKAEVLGRLVSCGFAIIEYTEINELTFFVVMKTGEPINGSASHYGPIFKTPKIGKNGKIIYVYNFRIMYPYSEYLQDYILQLHGYPIVSTSVHDFRLTGWGRFLKKACLDQLPQLINVLKGEMKLVGINPVSKKVLEEYPDDIKEKRTKYKPGFISPNMALLKEGSVQSIEAERIYLKEKEKNPLTTDLKYFFMAIQNIITNKIKRV